MVPLFLATLVAVAQANQPPPPPPPSPPPPSLAPPAASATTVVPVAPEPPAPAESDEGEKASVTRGESGNDAFGDVTMSGFSLRTLSQVRYGGTFTDGGDADQQATVKDSDGWRVNRMFLRIAAV